ncbi:MAG: fibronectin type III domain-containing protein [Thermoguttaceae bacterium]|nr:fibronectin type III domain-containing protein [Thermoguttaceae bacterium]
MVFNNHRRTVGKRRVLRTESLEERALLSAVPLTSGEYTDLTAKYSALELPGTADELNIITLDLSEGDGLTELRSAIAEAKKTPQSDLIVVRTTADANTITYTASGDRLEIPIDIGAYETGKTALGVPGWSVSVLGGDSVCVTLAGVPNASGYMIEYAANADLENAQTQTFTDSGALTISGIEADTEYFFRVKSIGTGEYADSKWSEAQSLTIQREAESLIVDTVLDVVDAYDGVTSIREAIALAKDGETVTFAESMRDQTIVLNGTPLELTKAVSLDADGLNVTLDGDFESTVLYVDPLSQTPFMLKGLTFINGAGGLRFSPAGIEHEAGVLSVIDCVIARNDGAGIYSSADTLTVKNSQIIQNEGVGLYFSEGRGLMVMNSEISRNGWDGIYVLTNALTLLNSTVTGNKFNGVYAYNNMFTVNNSIVTANLNGWDLYGNAKAANSIIGKTNPQYRVSLKSTQTGVRDPGFAYLPDFANYEEWLDAREEDWDLSLTSGSSAIDRGDTKLFTKTGMPQTSSDGAGNARVFGKKVDIGAYEFHAAFVETPQAEVMRSGKKLTVTWDAVPGASSYLVEYRDVQTAKWTLRTVKKGTSLAINGKVGTTYEIRVAAVTAYGNSNADVETVTVYAPLTTPKLKALRDFCKDDTFSVEVTNYAFYLADTSESVTIGMNGKYESFAIENGYGRADLASGETVTFKDGIFTVTNAKSSSQYKMEVMFANPLTGSAFAKVNVRTTKTTYLAPTDLQVTAKTANSISLDWSDSPAKNDASKLAQKYTVQYSTNGGKSWRSVSVKTSDATLTRLKPGMYLIRVLAAKDSKFEASLPTEILEIVL